MSEVLLKRSSSLDGVKRVAEIHNCVLMELNSPEETKGHFIFPNRKRHNNGEQLMPILSPRKSGGTKMSQADLIREFVQRNYIEPARKKKESQITIRAGDIDRKMGLGRVPNVNQVLGGRMLQNQCGIRLIEKRGPYQSSTTTYTYEVLPNEKMIKNVGYPSISKSLDINANRKKKDIPSIIRELFKLKEEGAITEEEFKKKKKDLLDKL